MSEDDFCDVCGEDISDGSSHYHCGNCGGMTGMFGHYNAATQAFDCAHVAGPWND